VGDLRARAPRHGGAPRWGSGSLGDSFAIAAWAIAAEVARLVAGLGAIWYVLATTTVEGTTMESIATEIVAAISTMQGPLLVASAVVISVQWVVVVGGLEAYHDLDRGIAGTVAGVLAVFGLLLAAV